MSRGDPIQNSFVAGYMSPRLRGRDDMKQYAQGMRQAYNGIVLPHGGFTKRPGTYYVATAKATTDPIALLTFEAAAEQQYVIEAGEDYLRFFANQGIVETTPGSGIPYEVVTTYENDQMRNLRTAQSADVMYMVHKDGYPYKLARSAFAAFTWTKVAFLLGHAPLRTRNLSPSFTITVTGSGPYTLTWSAVHGLTTGFDVGRAVKVDDDWYEITAIPSTTTATADLKDGTPTVGATSVWSLGLFSNFEGPRCVAFHEGRLWYGGSLNDPDYLVGSVSDDFDNFDPGNGEDADRAISRRVVGSQVNTIVWMQSQGNQLAIGTTGGEYRVFGANDDILTPTTTVIRPASNRGSAEVPPVLINNKVLFTHKDRRTISAFAYDLSQNSYLTTNLSIVAEDIYDDGGIQRLAYQPDQDSIVWAARGDGGLVGMTYEPEQQVIGHHQHDLGGDVLDVVCIQNPDATGDQLWALVEYMIGGVAVQYIVYMVGQFRPIIDQSRATVAQRTRALDDAFFVDCGLTLDNPLTISSISMANPVVVTSTAHGLSNGDRAKLRIPRIVPLDTEDDGETDYNGSELDNVSGVVANAAANTFEITGVDATGYSAYASGGTAREEVSTVTGLAHLNGRIVDVLADGAVHPQCTVSAGAITLQTPASIVHVGLPYRMRGETQRFAGGTAGGRVGTEQGKRSKIKRCGVILHNTLGLRVGTGAGLDPGLLEELQFRDGETIMDQPPPLFTGDLEVPVEHGWSRGPATVYFESYQPYPATVLAVMPRMETNERG